MFYNHWPWNFALEYTIRKVQETMEELELNRIHQPLIYTTQKYKYHKERTEFLTDVSKETGLEVHTEKTKYMFIYLITKQKDKIITF
jgi:hypothetical protein